jgi:hypothetical protein
MRRWSMPQALDTPAAKPFIEWVRERRESRQTMSSQSLHESRKKTDGEDIRMTQSDGGFGERSGSYNKYEREEIAPPVTDADVRPPTTEPLESTVTIIGARTKENRTSDVPPRSRVASWELPHAVNNQGKVVKAPSRNHREIHQHDQSTKERTDVIDGNYITNADRKRNPGLTGAKRSCIPMHFENAEQKRFAPSPKRTIWDRPSHGNRVASQDRVVVLKGEEEFEQPDLVPTTTEDTEETHSSKATNNGESNRLEVASFLLQYETMISQQEAEEAFTFQYILPLLDRLHSLGNEVKEFGEKACNTSFPNTRDAHHNDLWKRSFTYGHLKWALDFLEAGEQDTLQSESCMGQDKQLMLILRMLTQKHSVSMAEESAEEVSITWAEIVHCYRVCILGMLTLKHLPKPSAVRSRAKNRILAQLSLFEMPTRALLNETTVGNGDAFDGAFQGMQTCNEDRERNKETNFPRKNWVATAAICIAALTVAAGTGMIINPSKTLPWDKAVPLDSWKLQEPVMSPPALPFDSANLTDVAVPTIKSTFAPARGHLASIIPQRIPREFQELREAQIVLAFLSQSPDSAAEDNVTIDDTEQPSPQNRAHNWQSMPQKQQLAVSALFGATVGALGPSKMLVVIRFVSQALSLGNLGVVPASLVVVGAVAVAFNIFRGLKFVLDHFVFRKKRIA